MQGAVGGASGVTLVLLYHLLLHLFILSSLYNNLKIIILLEFWLAKPIPQTMVDNICSACSDLFYIAGKVMGLASTGLTWFAVCSLFNFAIVIP